MARPAKNEGLSDQTGHTWIDQLAAMRLGHWGPKRLQYFADAGYISTLTVPGTKTKYSYEDIVRLLRNSVKPADAVA